VGPQYVAVPPSFSCAKAILATERTICADPLLENVDADFTVYYQDNLTAAAIFQPTAIEAALKKSEADFIAARDRCGASRWCIEREYLYQDVHSADMSGEPHRVTTPLRVYVNHYVGAYLESRLRALADSRREASTTNAARIRDIKDLMPPSGATPPPAGAARDDPTFHNSSSDHRLRATPCMMSAASPGLRRSGTTSWWPCRAA
jgi:hypothetical protein